MAGGDAPVGIEATGKTSKYPEFSRRLNVTFRWAVGFHLGGRNISNQDLKTLLTFRSARERIESVPRGLRNSQPPKQ
jgi:hypothetical protein